jgi:SAM-dependent methyltransferase
MRAFRGRARRAVEWRTRRAAERVLEWRYGTETASHLYLEDLGLPAENRVWHDPSEWIPVRRALGRLGLERGDVFADLGSGLGRALLVAAEFPFDRVIGVELSEQMNEVARRNIERNGRRFRARSVEVVTADALDYEIPDDLTVAYLYCPFYGEIFARVLEKILASVDRRPRPLRLVYNYPAEQARLAACERVRLIDAIPGTWPRRSLTTPKTILTYLMLPSDETAAADLVRRYPPRLRGAERWLEPYDPGFGLEKPARLGGKVLR